MKTYGRMDVNLHACVTSTVDEVIGQLHSLIASHPGKSPPYTLDRRLGGPQSRSGRGGEEKNPWPHRKSNTVVQSVD
jgi:hypothetical protein